MNNKCNGIPLARRKPSRFSLGIVYGSVACGVVGCILSLAEGNNDSALCAALFTIVNASLASTIHKLRRS